MADLGALLMVNAGAAAPLLVAAADLPYPESPAPATAAGGPDPAESRPDTTGRTP